MSNNPIGQQGELQDFQARILGGALTFGQKTVYNIMTKVDDIYALNELVKLDVDTMVNSIL
jgi:CBS domain containing-hemolysin-like protein